MKWLLFALCAPWTFLVSWPLVLFFSLFAAEELRVERNGVLTAIWRDWVCRNRGNKPPLWPYSTTIGRGVIYQPHLRRHRQCQPLTPTERHELVHVRQHEDCMALAFIVGLSVALSVGLALGEWVFGATLGAVLWATGGVWQAPNFLTSVVRHGLNSEGFYFSTSHERSARAQTEVWCHLTEIAQRESWADYDRRMRLRGRFL